MLENTIPTNPPQTAARVEAITQTPGGATRHPPSYAGRVSNAPWLIPSTDPPTLDPSSVININDFHARLQSMFPWIASIGITVDQIQGWAVNLLTGDSLVSAIRQTPQWQARFPGIRRPDGSLRSDEATYLATEDNYRKVLKQWGAPGQTYDQPWELAAFFDNEIDANELNQRFQVFDAVSKNKDAQDAFYVYAGLKPSVDDLYQAAVSPAARQRLEDTYNQAVASSPLDYHTWITRATEAGLGRVADSLTDLQQNGIITGTAISRIQSVNPDFARQMMDALYHGGDGTKTLDLNSLMNSFQYAMLGSAATDNGLALPDKDRIEALRQAGVDRTKALDAYSQFATKQNLLSGMAQRAGLASKFTQDDFEQAVLLHQGPAVQEMAQAQSQEDALSKSAGSANFNMDRNGRLTQSGLRQTGQ